VFFALPYNITLDTEEEEEEEEDKISYYYISYML